MRLYSNKAIHLFIHSFTDSLKRKGGLKTREREREREMSIFYGWILSAGSKYDVPKKLKKWLCSNKDMIHSFVEWKGGG